MVWHTHVMGTAELSVYATRLVIRKKSVGAGPERRFQYLPSPLANEIATAPSGPVSSKFYCI